MEKSEALACSLQLASTDLVRSTWMVAFAVVGDVTSNPISRDVTCGFEPTTAAQINHASPAAVTTATTTIRISRRDRRLRPYLASRSVVALPADVSLTWCPGGRSWVSGGLGGPLCLVSGDL